MSKKVKNLINKNYKKKKNWYITKNIIYWLLCLYNIFYDIFIHTSMVLIIAQSVLFSILIGISYTIYNKDIIEELNEKIKETEEIE